MNNDTLKVGDFVTCSRSGWWKVRGLDQINNNKISLELVLDHKGNVPKNIRIIMSYKNHCKKIDIENIKMQKDSEVRKYNNLLYIINPKMFDPEDNSLNIDESLKNNKKVDPEYLTKLRPPDIRSR